MGFLGGHFDGSMESEGSGARVKAGVRDIPLIGDVNIVDTHVSGFRDGGTVGERQRTSPSRAAAGSQAFGQMAHPLADVVGGRSHGFHGNGRGSYYCPSCAMGITTPLN
ncbi:hypothetical protein [Gordonia sputi]|uniref:hypothetical protein n=1 Tax=Gordonia sputi TaxID=36823 RepID=UPI0036B67139